MKRDTRPGQNDRGQAYTVEGILAATILLTAVLFSVQATVTTPTSSGASDSAAQKRALAQDALLAVENNGTKDLDYIIRYWVPGTDSSSAGFQGDVFTNTSLGETLNETLSDGGLQYNLYIEYYNNSTASRTEEPKYLHRSGTPDETAVTASRTVTLYDGDTFTSEASGTISSQDADFYVTDDTAPNSLVFAVVEVRLVVW